MALGIGAAAMLLIGLPLAQPQLFWGAADAIADGISPAREFLVALSDRSPGKRTQGELTKVKQKAAAAKAKPTQRALAKVVKPKEAPPALVEALTTAPPMIVPPAVPPITTAGVIPPTGGTPPIGGPPGVLTPPPGGNPPPPPPTIKEVPPPAVPEPGTWAMMLLGFGMAGFALRKQAPVKIPLPASP